MKHFLSVFLSLHYSIISNIKVRTRNIDLHNFIFGWQKKKCLENMKGSKQMEKKIEKLAPKNASFSQYFLYLFCKQYRSILRFALCSLLCYSITKTIHVPFMKYLRKIILLQSPPWKLQNFLMQQGLLQFVSIIITSFSMFI